MILHPVPREAACRNLSEGVRALRLANVESRMPVGNPMLESRSDLIPIDGLGSRMKISREDVLHVAELAHLELSEAEVASIQRELDSILTYMEKLGELDTAKVEPLAQVLLETRATDKPGVDGALREDVTAACILTGEVLAGAPDPSPPYFRVPKVIDR